MVLRLRAFSGGQAQSARAKPHLQESRNPEAAAHTR